MKQILLATTVLGLSTGFSLAEVALSGDARMGIIGGDSVDTGFTSRARVKFTLSGETDGGLAFGASFRADNASSGACTDGDGDGACDGTESGADNGTAGEVFLSGAFGKLSMGDVDGSGAAAVGQVSGVGLTGLGDLNEILYLANGGTDFQDGAGTSDDPSALYEYSSGAFTGYISATNPTGDVEAEAIGAKYSAGNYTVSVAFERAFLNVFAVEINQVALGASATFGAATLKAVYGQVSLDGLEDLDQFAISLDYSVDALTVTAFYRDNEDLDLTPLGGTEAFGLGASYDLGGGAKLVGGYVSNESDDDDAFDLGLSFSF